MEFLTLPLIILALAFMINGFPDIRIFSPTHHHYHHDDDCEDSKKK